MVQLHHRSRGASRTTLLLVAALGLFAGAIVFMLTRAGGAPDRVVTPTLDVTNAPLVEEDAAADLVSVTDGAENGSTRTAAQAAATAGLAPDAEAANEPSPCPFQLIVTVEAEGQVQGASSVDWKVDVRRPGDPVFRDVRQGTGWDIGSTHELDMGWFYDAHGAPSHAAVTLTHETLEGAQAIAYFGADGVARASVFLRKKPAGGEYAVVADVVPRKGLDSGTTRFLVWHELGGRPSGFAVAEVAAQPGTPSTIPLPGPGEYLLVASHPTHLPVARQVSVSPGAPIEDTGRLELPRGESLHGKFTLGGAAPSGPVLFQLEHAHGGVPLRLDEFLGNGGSVAPFLWSGGRVERVGGLLTTGPEGGFELSGLAPGPHGVVVRGFQLVDNIRDIDASKPAPALPFLVQGHGRSEWPTFTVAVPSRDQVLELGASMLAIHVSPEEDNHEPQPARLIVYRAGGQLESHPLSAADILASAPLELAFPPEEPLRLALESPGMEPIILATKTPAAGAVDEVRFSLPAIPADGKLSIEWQEKPPADGTAYVVHVAPVGAAGQPSDAEIYDSVPARLLVVTEGRLLVEGLAMGAYHVVAYEGEHEGHRATMDLAAHGDVVVRGGQTANLRLAPRVGGRLILGVRSASGAWLAESCTIQDSRNEDLEPVFLAYGANDVGAMATRNFLSNLGPSQVVPNLPAGTYRVTIGQAVRTVEVKEGEITQVVLGP